MPALLVTIYGPFFIPVVYFLITKRKGRMKKEMILGFVLHTIWIIAAYGLVYYSWKSGASEWYWGTALYPIVGVISWVYFLTMPFWTKLYKNKTVEQDGGAKCREADAPRHSTP